MLAIRWVAPDSLFRHFAVWDVVQLPVLVAIVAFLPLAGVAGHYLVTDTIRRAGPAAHRIVLGSVVVLIRRCILLVARLQFPIFCADHALPPFPPILSPSSRPVPRCLVVVSPLC